MLLAKILRSTLRCLGVAVQTGLVLFEEFLLDCDVVVCNAKDDHAVLGLSLLLGECTIRLAAKVALSDNLVGMVDLTSEWEFRHQFILNKDKCLHGMLKGQLVLAHLTEDGTDVQMDVARI